MSTLTDTWMAWEESRWTPAGERVARAGVAARDEALMCGAPLADAAWLGVEAIDAAVCAQRAAVDRADVVRRASQGRGR